MGSGSFEAKRIFHEEKRALQEMKLKAFGILWLHSCAQLLRSERARHEGAKST